MKESDDLSAAEIQTVVCEVLASVLGIESVQPHENFLLLGGESLLATQAGLRIRARLGVDVSIRSILIDTVEEIGVEIGTMLRQRKVGGHV